MYTKLSERQIIEKLYHNKKYSGDKVFFNNNSVQLCYTWFYSLFLDVKDLKVLDFGSGDGWLSFQLAERGALVWGIDISEELVRRANSLNNYQGSVNFLVMAAEDLDFKDDYFDLIIGSAILHHTEIDQSVQEIKRVLKSNGRALVIEPMTENIILKCWRWLTPWRRSPTERALVWDDILFINKLFPNAKLTFFCFMSIFSSGMMILFPNSQIITRLNKFVEKLDFKLLSLFPWLGKYCAVVVIEMKK